MSLAEPADVTCPSCGHSQSFMVWQSLNVSLDQEQKRELLEGRLMRSACRRCGHVVDLLHPLLYHDPERQLMIWLWPGPGDPAWPAQTGLAPGYRLRIVRTLNELIEKVLIFDSECDDRELELFKAAIRAQSEGDQELDGRLFFGGVHTPPGGGETLELVLVHDGATEAFAYPMSAYREAVASLRDSIALNATRVEGVPLRVDEDFAAELLSRLSAEDDAEPD